MLKTTAIAMGMLAATATIALANDWRAEGYGSHRSGGQAAYGYDNGSSALGRYCPAGQYPHSWPNGGWRCQYANGDFSGAGNW